MINNPYITVDERLKKSDLKIILFFLFFIIMIISSLILLFLNTRKIDKDYSNYIIKHNELINASTTYLHESSVMQRRLLNLAIVVEPIEKKQCKERFKAAYIKNQTAFNLIKAQLLQEDSKNSAIINEAQIASKEYINAGLKFEELLLTNNREEISSFLSTSLRPKLAVYQEKQMQIFEQISRHSISYSEKMNSYSNITSIIILIIGLFPFLFVIYKLSFNFLFN